MSAGIEIVKGRFFKLFFFGAWKDPFGNEHDVMGAMFRDAGEPWRATYRFRDYASKDPWDIRDAKRWYELKGKTVPESDTIDQEGQMLERDLRLAFGQMPDVEVQFVEVGSDDPDRVFEVLQEQPWCHTKPMDIKGQA